MKDSIYSGSYKIDKECKHSRRYKAEDEKAPIQSIYVSRSSELSKNDTLTLAVGKGGQS